MNYRSNFISFDDAKKLVISALYKFNPELADRATCILSNPNRLNIVGVLNPITHMMQYRPAGRENNQTEYGIIDLEYDGTPSSVVWLGHELGHAIADDIQTENGHSGSGIFSDEENEAQAYFIQQIVSQYLKENLNHPDMLDDDLNRDLSTMSEWRRVAYTNASQTLQTALAIPASERQSFVLKALDQRLG